ncbi:MAG: hypothetical protein Ta2A_21500 [Treponemataceae bacterium]|nr:MAG: hypothetical protein Ta2A_21500 [Treponemataceae bacterium]
MIFDALAAYSGIMLLVSHDRALLDALCSQCIFLEGGSATVRPGGVSQGRIEQERELMEARRNKTKIENEKKAAGNRSG